MQRKRCKRCTDIGDSYMKRIKYIMSIAIIILNLVACQKDSQQDNNQLILDESKDMSIATF